LSPDVVYRSRRIDEVIIEKHVKAAKEVTPSTFLYYQLEAENPILNGRPFTTRATPVHLYHDAFTTFTSIYNDTSREIPSNIQKHIYDLCQASSQLYETRGMEKRVTGERLDAIRSIYSMILDESIRSTGDPDADTGAITTTTSDSQEALRGILENENEIGAGGFDPNLQGCLSYIKYWSMDEVHTCSYYFQA
jgi:hypothetical protein